MFWGEALEVLPFTLTPADEFTIVINLEKFAIYLLLLFVIYLDCYSFGGINDFWGGGVGGLALHAHP